MDPTPRRISLLSRIVPVLAVGVLAATSMPAHAEAVFGAEQPIGSGMPGLNSVIAADLDGDGDLDAVTVSEIDDTVAWRANTDGQGTFGAAQPISTAADGAQSVAAADVDGDGDLDVVVASYYDDTVAWYANTDGLGSFGPAQAITTTADGARHAIVADVDHDGDLDVIVASDIGDTVTWHANTDGQGTFGPAQTVSAMVDGAWWVAVGDIDEDGDLDVLSAASDGGTVFWHENTDGVGGSWTDHVVAATTDGVTCVDPVDVDADGDLDVFTTSYADDTIQWFENTDGQGSYVPKLPISTSANGAWAVSGVDMDGDGDLDAIAASFNGDTVAWYENADGRGSFGPGRDLTTGANGASSAVAADLDRDGDLDVLATAYFAGTLTWFENEAIHRTAAWSHAGPIGPSGVYPSVSSADLDGDGDLDAIAASYFTDEILWFENTDGRGTFGPEQVVSATAGAVRTVLAADVDGDGDADVLALNEGNDLVAWYENTDGNGTFGPAIPIASGLIGALSLSAADIDGDGDVDVLSTSVYPPGYVFWFENVANGSYFLMSPVTNIAGDPFQVVAADMDGDGDPDVLTSFLTGDRLSWFENVDGQGGFGTEQNITQVAEGPQALFAADLDGDGDLDVLTGSVDDATVSWFENTGGPAFLWPRQLISTTSPTILCVYAADLDGDGDVDPIAASSAGIEWFENTDGAGAFSPARTITRVSAYGQGITAADVDGDGDIDVFADVWYENVDGRGHFHAPTIVRTAGASSVLPANVDGDGDLDAVLNAPGTTRLGWWENSNAWGAFGNEQQISTSLEPMHASAGDLDGDGDVDVLTDTSTTLVWHANPGGPAGSWPAQVIAGSTPGFVVTADLDGDGDVDAISASDAITWHANTNGQGAFGAQQTVAPAGTGAIRVSTADVDGDGDLDVLSASEGNDTVAWFENTDGQGTFGSEQTITTAADGAVDVHAADLDGDGDLDVLSASALDDRIAWYENTDGQGTFGPQQTLSPATESARSVFATDVDRDGDLDVIALAGTTGPSHWFENTDGQGTFGPGQVLPSIDGPGSVVAADLDGDGAPDVAGPGPGWAQWRRNATGQVAFRTQSLSPTPTGTIGGPAALLRIDLMHRGRPGDADAELESLALRLEVAPPPPLVEPASALSTAEANAIFASFSIYRDDGSGVLEAGSDPIVANVSTLDLTAGFQTLTLTSADPNAQVATGDTARFFVVATPAATAGLHARGVRVRHVAAFSQVRHAGSDQLLVQSPGTGSQPYRLLVLNPLADEDGDGLANGDEQASGSNPFDADSDDDGLSDADEVNVYGTDPMSADTDADGVQDGTELGVTTGVPDPDGAGPLLGTASGGFVPDADPASTTNPLLADTDGDGFSDGQEDLDGNGRVDPPFESDPADPASTPNVPVVPLGGPIAVGLLAALLAASGGGLLRAHGGGRPAPRG